MDETLFNVCIECGKDVARIEKCSIKDVNNLLEMMPRFVVKYDFFYQKDAPTMTITLYEEEDKNDGESNG